MRTRLLAGRPEPRSSIVLPLGPWLGVQRRRAPRRVVTSLTFRACLERDTRKRFTSRTEWVLETTLSKREPRLGTRNERLNEPARLVEARVRVLPPSLTRTRVLGLKPVPFTEADAPGAPAAGTSVTLLWAVAA
jgi:hypothetical protein